MNQNVGGNRKLNVQTLGVVGKIIKKTREKEIYNNKKRILYPTQRFILYIKHYKMTKTLEITQEELIKNKIKRKGNDTNRNKNNNT